MLGILRGPRHRESNHHALTRGWLMQTYVKRPGDMSVNFRGQRLSFPSNAVDAPCGCDASVLPGRDVAWSLQ